MKSIDFFFFTILSTHLEFSKTQTEKNSSNHYSTVLDFAGGKNQICSLTLLRSLQTISDYFVIPWIYIWVFTQLLKSASVSYTLEPPNLPVFQTSFITFILYFTCQPWLKFFLFLNFSLNLVLIMAPSWTAGAWTLLAALGLLSFCSFGSCEASRTSSSTSGGRREDQGPSSLERVKRGWVWNQFFVVEEYTGTEPLYVGKVRHSFVFSHDVFL